MMLEYLFLLCMVVIGGWGCSLVGINSAWVIVPLIALTLPSVYALCTASSYVSTDPETLKKMIRLAKIQTGERVADIGCGDGRILLAARNAGAEITGYELSVYLYLLSRWRCGNVIRFANFWNADLSQYDILFIFHEKRFLPRFEREIWPTLKTGCRVISGVFPLPNIPPDTNSEFLVYVYHKQ